MLVEIVYWDPWIVPKSTIEPWIIAKIKVPLFILLKLKSFYWKYCK